LILARAVSEDDQALFIKMSKIHGPASGLGVRQLASPEMLGVRTGSKYFFKKCKWLQLAASLCNWVQERVRFCGWLRGISRSTLYSA